ncbi:hypothetical protein RRG08_031947 [Elysia crispata]|uniref:Uncharacterized protein n=1 Tax=Elysia crispata TaxID=231223 RepID=A0AAE0Z3Z3_9GAST|nr:hypothetical protein RRG08_031947 [Elysia crispata]
MPFEKLLLIIIRHKNFNPQNSSPGNKPNVSTADHHCLNLLLHSDQAVQGHDRKSTNSFIMMKSDEKRSQVLTKKAVSDRGLERGGHQNHHPAMALITKLREVQYTSVVNLVSMTRVAPKFPEVQYTSVVNLVSMTRVAPKFPEVHYTSVVNLVSMTRVATQVSRAKNADPGGKEVLVQKKKKKN